MQADDVAAPIEGEALQGGDLGARPEKGRQDREGFVLAADVDDQPGTGPFESPFTGRNILRTEVRTEEGEVRWWGLEPPRLAAHGPQPCLSANSSTSAGPRRVAERGIIAAVSSLSTIIADSPSRRSA